MHASPLSAATFRHPHTELLRANPSRVLVAAHRGVCSDAPENSIAAIHEAIAQGADIVELDVRATQDGVLVLLHDATLDRTSTGSGLLSAQRFSQIRAARLTDVAQVPRSPLPTLAEALEAARSRIIVNIDLKDSHHAERVAHFVIAAGVAEQVFVKAPISTPEDIARVLNSPLLGRVAFVPIVHARPARFADDLRDLQVLQSPMVEASFNNLADLEAGRTELQRQGMRLWVNTIEASHSLDFSDARARSEPDAVWGRLLQAGVGAIQTDDVSRLVRFLEQAGRR